MLVNGKREGQKGRDERARLICCREEIGGNHSARFRTLAISTRLHRYWAGRQAQSPAGRQVKEDDKGENPDQFVALDSASTEANLNRSKYEEHFTSQHRLQVNSYSRCHLGLVNIM